MKNPSWVKMYRKVLESDFWTKDDESFDFRSAFFHAVLTANWKPGVSRQHGHTVRVERGQWLTSVRKLEKTFGWSKRRVESWLDFMKENNMISVQPLSGIGTLLTIEKYDVYQSERYADEHADEHADDLRYKKIEDRSQTEESISPADAGTPPAVIGPSRGSPEWYKLHYDD